MTGRDPAPPRLAGGGDQVQGILSGVITKGSGDSSMMTELDRRSEVTNEFGPDYRVDLSLVSPPLEKLAGSEMEICRKLLEPAVFYQYTIPKHRRGGL